MSASYHHSLYYATKKDMALCSIFNPVAFLCKLPSHRIAKKGGRFSRIGVVSSHSNPRILKPKHRSRYGELLSPYDSDEEDDDGEEDSDDDEWFSDDDLPQDEDSDFDGKMSKSMKASRMRRGSSLEKKRGSCNSSKRLTGKAKGSESIDKNRYHRLLEEIDIDDGCFPLLDYLSTFGLKDSHFLQMYERHMPSLQINVASAQERLEFLLSVGVKQRDIRKIVMRQPQILEYTVENNLKSHVAFLSRLDIPDSKIGQIITAAPSLFSYSVNNSLEPTVKYLQEEVGIQKSEISKVVQLSPQILVQRIDSSWKSRLNFLTKELNAPRESVVKMVTKHPQLLHYSIEDGLLPRINFLRSIGLRNADILKVSTSLSQVFSLSLEANLKPKYSYLVNELQNEVQSLTKYPTYLSLSLDQRIRPRHRFLVSLKKAPRGPFPLSSFVPTDQNFCQQYAKTSLDRYLDFRQKLLIKEFAKKYER